MRKIKNNSSQNTSKQRLYYIAFKNNFRLVLLGKSHFIFFSTDILIFTYPAKKIICDYSTLFFRVVYRFQTVIWHFGCFPSSRMVSNSTCHRIFTLSSNADLWNLKVACVHVVSVFVFTYKQLRSNKNCGFYYGPFVGKTIFTMSILDMSVLCCCPRSKLRMDIMVQR